NWSEADATWNMRTATQPWSAGGAMSGVDYSGVSSASAFLDVSGSTNAFTSAALAADVQAWLANPASNFGWFIAADGETAGSGKQIGSRENPGNEPMLTIEYTVPLAPPTAPVLTVVPPTNGFGFSFQVEALHGYQVQFIGDLTKTNWSTAIVL